MNDHSFQPAMMSPRPVLFFFALCVVACAEAEAISTAGVSDAGRDVNRAGDAPFADVSSTVDARAMTDTILGDGAREGDAIGPRDAALDGVRDDRSSNDAISEGTSRDAPSWDASGDPTAPRFARTGVYTTLIPPLGDAGAGTGDAGAGDPADVYYPNPPDLHTGRYVFPVVLLLQGAKVARRFYSGVAAGVAGYGFIVVVPDHTSNNIGGPGLYAELVEIAAVSAQMKLESASPTAPVRGVIDTMRIAVMGHSYGGASGLSAMTNACFPPVPLCTFTRPPDLVAGAFYGTNLATPVLGVPALDTGGLPVLLVQGDRDGKALLADAQKTYDQIQKRPKALIALLGANHYGITDVDNPAGADPEVNAQTLDHAKGLASTARWMGLFLAAFVQGDMAARGALRVAGSLDPNVTITLAE